MDIKQVPAHTNNYGKGRERHQIKYIIAHWIVGTLASADATFQSPTRKASAHYGREGTTVHQYVDEKDTAWHASNLKINRESIGIEHSGGEKLYKGLIDRRKPSAQTHKTSAFLVADICKRYNIVCSRDNIFPHNKFSNTQCPGSLDIDLIIKMAKDIIEPIMATKQTVDLGGLQTKLEKYDVIEVNALKSKLKAKDQLIFNLQKQEAKEETISFGFFGTLGLKIDEYLERAYHVTKRT